jgi:2'-5' RNA ligase
MLKFILLSLLVFNITAQASKTTEPYYLDSNVQKNADLKFISHQGDGRFATYLTMEVQYAPVKNVFEQIQTKTQLKLKNRGEAHITVITPIEYFDVLKSHLTMNEIDKLAQSLNIQAAGFEVKCLGRGEVTAAGKIDQTFYIVVNSVKLLEIRKEIQKLFEQKGGEVNSFKAEVFYPHITVGFTTRDLHESDGVIKNESSCVGDIVYKPSK